MATMTQAAVEGLDVAIDAGIVRVRDGQDTWLCGKDAWDAALAKLDVREAAVSDESGADAYSALCHAIRTDVASINGTSRGDWHPLVQAAFVAGLIDADDARAYGVEVQS